ncbi:MAG: hypothetical protein P8M26_04160 [Gammaproteobacteria bacterium]|nr:hypothetical protein [Gammaproteobacteria bacterium]
MIKRYLLAVALIVCLGAFSVIGFNWLINPMGLFSSPLIPGVNVVKPNMFAYDRQLKSWGISKFQPEGLILGSSRASVGLNPEHSAWQANEVFNSALSATSAYLIYRYLRHAQATRPLKQVVLGLDFLSFNADLANTMSLDERLLSVDEAGRRNPDFLLSRVFQSLYSWNVLMASVSVLSANRKEVNRKVDPDSYLPPLARNGVMQPDSFLSKFWVPLRERAYGTLRQYLTTLWFPEQGFAFSDQEGVESDLLGWYRQTVRYAYEEDIDLRLFISPSHAYLFEAIHASGLWEIWEEWKRLLVAINEEEALRAGREPFPLWDFANYNDYSAVTVPMAAGKGVAMPDFWDVGHYRQEMGDLVLDRVLGGAPPAGFGVPLNGASIDGHLARVRESREAYRSEYVEELVELDAALSDILAGETPQ